MEKEETIFFDRSTQWTPSAKLKSPCLKVYLSEKASLIKIQEKQETFKGALIYWTKSSKPIYPSCNLLDSIIV